MSEKARVMLLAKLTELIGIPATKAIATIDQQKVMLFADDLVEPNPIASNVIPTTSA